MKREMRGFRRGGFVGPNGFAAGPAADAPAVTVERSDALISVSGDPGEEDGGSVLALIRVSLVAGEIGSGFVDHWLADLILFAGPIAKIEQTAALAAEGEVGILLRLDRLAADRAMPFHRKRIAQTRRGRKPSEDDGQSSRLCKVNRPSGVCVIAGGISCGAV